MELLGTLALTVFILFFGSLFRNDVIIHMTKDGFTPKEVTIGRRQAIRFINDDKGEHWPASDPHPIHDAYTQFDPGGPILPGASWVFRPTQQGVWGFHDHVQPRLRGKLTVAPSSSIFDQAIFGFVDMIDTIRMSLEKKASYGLRVRRTDEDTDSYILSQMKICAKEGNRSPCYTAITEIFLRQFSTKDILLSFKRIEKEPEIYSRCHEVGHYLGRIEYRRHKSIAQAFNTCSVMVCGVGCQHGAAEEYFRDMNMSNAISDEALGSFVRQACGSEKDYSGRIIYQECLHGLGHGILTFVDMELPRALTVCDALPEAWDREGCYAGAFMENSTSATNLDHPSRYVRPDDPTYPCSIVDQKYWKLCYQYQSSYFGERTGWDFKKTADLCRKIPYDYQAGCFNQIATNQAMATQDPQQAKKTCDLLDRVQEKDRCVDEVVSTFGGRYIDEPAFMLSFCDAVDEENKETCYKQLGSTLSYWGKTQTEREKFCKGLANPKYTSWCTVDQAGEMFVGKQ